MAKGQSKKLFREFKRNPNWKGYGIPTVLTENLKRFGNEPLPKTAGGQLVTCPDIEPRPRALRALDLGPHAEWLAARRAAGYESTPIYQTGPS